MLPSNIGGKYHGKNREGYKEKELSQTEEGERQTLIEGKL